MTAVYLVPDGGEIARRRASLPAGTFVEAWPDLYTSGHVWLGSGAKQILDAVGVPLTPVLTLDADRVPVYYGPRLSDLESLPPEESLRARVLSAAGVAVAWVTLDQFGDRNGARAESPLDPTFFLRRRGGPSAHLWRLFRSHDEAVVYLREYYASDPEAQAWAKSIIAVSFADLIERHGRREPPGAR